MNVHPSVAAFGRTEGCLCVGGIPISRLAERAGSTPFFAYDRALLTKRVEMLRSTFPGGIDLSYAVKANPMPAVVQHLSALVDSFDVASVKEMLTALDTPTPASRISFAGPGKTESELRQAISAGVLIEIESETEAKRVATIGAELRLKPSVAVRVNPDFEVKGSAMRLGGGPQQFGVDSERVPSLVRQLIDSNVEFQGFHVFPGSQNLRAEILCDTQRKTVQLTQRLAEAADVSIHYLNLGGGFGIPYFENDSPLDLRTIGANLADLMQHSIRPNLPADARVVMELGRYIVGECGVYVTRIIDKKESRGQTFLIVDGGLHHQLAASGNFGQVLRRNYPLAIGNRIDEERSERVNIVGCLCTPLDLLGNNVAVPKSEIGDLVVIFQAGAYGLTASPTGFLGHPAPVEMLI